MYKFAKSDLKAINRLSRSQKKNLQFGDTIPNHLSNFDKLNMTAPVDYTFTGKKPSRGLNQSHFISQSPRRFEHADSII
jgi:hypothetical protein